MSVTVQMLQLDPDKYLVPFGNQGEYQFQSRNQRIIDVQNPTGISAGECELLYGLIRLCKPKVCVEGGTNIGCSATAIALALYDNDNDGSLTTIEHNGTVAMLAKGLLSQYTNVTVVEDNFVHWWVTQGCQLKIDFAFLDTELS